jgi:hypothetical protein
MITTEQAQPRRKLSRPEIAQLFACIAVALIGFSLAFWMSFMVPDASFGTVQLSEAIAGAAMMLLGYKFMPKWAKEPTV